MTHSKKRIGSRGLIAVTGVALASAVMLAPVGSTALAQPQQGGSMQDGERSLAEQIAELRASLIRLESQLARDRRAIGSGKNAGQGAIGPGGMGGSKGGMGGKGAMGGGQQGGQAGGKGGMGGGKAGGAMGGMGGQRGAMGGGMGSMGGGKKGGATGPSAMGSMGGSAARLASLPGFPGASHLYHIGATDFFLDHNEHITLSADQQAALAGIREQSQLEAATFERQIAELEQELWVLTASDQPDIAQIEQKIRKIERVSADQRIAFIRAIGAAAQTLTENQRMALVGAGTMAPSGESSDQHDQHQHGNP